MNRIEDVIFGRRLTGLVLFGAALFSQAQDLSTEITVDRIVEPSQRAALRPSLMPQTLSPTLKNGYPQAAEWFGPGNVEPMLTRLSAAKWEDSIAHSPYRGYLSGGYFPTLNFGADAGYRFIDTEKAWFGAAAQYHGIDYSRDGYDLNHQDARLWANGGYKPNSYSALKGCVSYRFDKVQEPFFNSVDETDRFYFTQTAHEFDISAQWLSQPGRFSYDLGAKVNAFRFSEASPATMTRELNPLSQTEATFRVGFGLAEADEERALAIATPRKYGVDAEGAFLSTNNSAGTLGLYRIKPYARFGRNNFKGHAGLGISIASGGGSSLQVSPELSLAYAPADRPYAASVSLTGGKEFNAVRGLFAIDPYVSPVASYGFSRVLMDLEARFALGPIAGFELEAFGGFALPREWLMPALTDRNGLGGTIFASVNAESSRLGLRMSYSYKSYFSIGASAQMAHSEDGLMTWYRWSDSAKYVFSAWAGTRPINGLDIRISYDLRRCRSILTSPDVYEGLEPGRLSLGDASCVTAKASYQITPQLTAFVNAEIHNKHLMISALPAPTLTGLAGVSFKF
ncbi:MAG: hypothetical protein NC102_08910 [Clostridium sp.]|nr:hypothetical protein [Clostridium sp.]